MIGIRLALFNSLMDAPLLEAAGRRVGGRWPGEKCEVKLTWKNIFSYSIMLTFILLKLNLFFPLKKKWW